MAWRKTRARRLTGRRCSNLGEKSGTEWITYWQAMKILFALLFCLFCQKVISYCGPLGWPFRATCPKQIQGKSRSRQFALFVPQVQELHEEEAQWVNYDEDELFVKMQLADSIFDSLLKDTVNVLTLIHDKRAKRDKISSELPR